MPNFSQTVNQDLSLTEQRLQIDYLSGSNLLTNPLDGQDVILGLTQTPKTLPARYFYDQRGSELFEQICELPEYYPTKTEAQILRQYAQDISQMTGVCELVELGSGSSTKTRLLLEAYQALESQFRYVPIDVSGEILVASAQQLQQDYPKLDIQGLVGTYAQALETLKPSTLPSRMIFFLGSSLGNFTPPECDRFLNQINTALAVGEYFLLGLDLHKPKHILEVAYNDSQGVTAAFNLNMLEHLNQRFGGDFDTKLFEHWAFYNEELNQIEMHLRSSVTQTVSLAALKLKVEFTAGETIKTEISRKFNLEEIKQQLQAQGLKPLTVWTDPKQWFGLFLAQKSEVN